MNTILLVEDDPSLIDIYTTKLKQDGFSVRVAKNGQEAFELLKKEVPDLLVLDIVLPQVDGWDVLSKIKENKKWEKIPIDFNVFILTPKLPQTSLQCCDSLE